MRDFQALDAWRKLNERFEYYENCVSDLTSDKMSLLDENSRLLSRESELDHENARLSSELYDREDAELKAFTDDTHRQINDLLLSLHNTGFHCPDPNTEGAFRHATPIVTLGRVIDDMRTEITKLRRKSMEDGTDLHISREAHEDLRTRIKKATDLVTSMTILDLQVPLLSEICRILNTETPDE